MRLLSYLPILDHPHNLQTLASKLPFNLQDQWRCEAVRSRVVKVSTPSFASFVDFVKIEAKLATNPIFSRETLKIPGHGAGYK